MKRVLLSAASFLILALAGPAQAQKATDEGVAARSASKVVQQPAGNGLPASRRDTGKVAPKALPGDLFDTGKVDPKALPGDLFEKGKPAPQALPGDLFDAGKADPKALPGDLFDKRDPR